MTGDSPVPADAEAMNILDERTAAAVRGLCELLVPGSGRVGPEVYVDARLTRMVPAERAFVLHAVSRLAPAIDGGAAALVAHEDSPEFALVRSLACEAFYSDFVAAGAPGPGAWKEIGFQPPLAARLNKDWSYLQEGS